MHISDGCRAEVNAALACSVRNLLREEQADNYFVLYRDFANGRQFSLYQNPASGEISSVRGRGDHVLKYAYQGRSVELISVQAAQTGISLTALKTTMLLGTIFKQAVFCHEDIPNAQPLSLSDWNFEVIGASMNPEKLAGYQFDELWPALAPDFERCGFARGCAAALSAHNGVQEAVRSGDLVVVKRSRGAPTFGVVTKVTHEDVNVAVESGWGKHVPRNNLERLIVGHWPAGIESEQKRRKVAK